MILELKIGKATIAVADLQAQRRSKKSALPALFS
jgi:hypothetical protein